MAKLRNPLLSHPIAKELPRMNVDEFRRLAGQGYNRIPLTLEVPADLETPLSVYLKIARGPLLLPAGIFPGRREGGRYSIIGLPASTRLVVYGEKIEVWQHDEIIESAENKDPLGFVERFKDRYRVPLLPELPRFSGGLVGYFGYDTVRYSERELKHSAPPDHLETPDVLLMVSNDVIVFDNLKGRMTLISHANPHEADGFEATRARLRALAAKLSDPFLRKPPAPPAGATAPDESDFTSSFGQRPLKLL